MPELFSSLDFLPAYRVLARKYRPATFEELIGQEAMVKTLVNAIKTGRLPHAWMLTGVRGVGKTTTARIIARALNCTGKDGKSGPTAHPCGKCASCIAIAEDRHMDVQEMDAASRTGVDDIRDIIEGVRYGPVSARYKIYILDEVHMLSKNAFNALLKTLEEPPPHVKFIFATTEVRKVPVTVLSRCQRFDLRRIDSTRLAEHFSAIVEKEKGKADPEAIKLIARAADGSVRDGLSLLDQALARGNGEVREADVKDMLGIADRAQIIDLCRQLLRGEMHAALENYRVLQQAGTDPLQVLQDLTGLIHGLTRAQVIPRYIDALELPEVERNLFKELVDVKIPALTRSWQILLKGITEVQFAPHPAEAAEMVLIRLAYAANLPPPGELIRKLQESISTDQVSQFFKTAPSGGGKTRGSMALAVSHEIAPAVKTETVAAQSMPTTFHEIVSLFAANREGGLYAQLCNYVHVVNVEPGKLEVRLEPEAQPNLVNRVSQCLKQWTGKRWMVSVVDKPGRPTIAEEERRAKEEHMTRVCSYPLVQAVLSAFPKANILGVKKKEGTSFEFVGNDEEIEGD